QLTKNELLPSQFDFTLHLPSRQRVEINSAEMPRRATRLSIPRRPRPFMIAQYCTFLDTKLRQPPQIPLLGCHSARQSRLLSFPNRFYRSGPGMRLLPLALEIHFP